MQVKWLFVGIISILVINAAAQSCPTKFNSDAQMVMVVDRTVPLDELPAAGVDTNLTFFRDVLQYDDARIQQ